MDTSTTAEDALVVAQKVNSLHTADILDGWSICGRERLSATAFGFAGLNAALAASLTPCFPIS